MMNFLLKMAFCIAVLVACHTVQASPSDEMQQPLLLDAEEDTHGCFSCLFGSTRDSQAQEAEAAYQQAMAHMHGTNGAQQCATRATEHMKKAAKLGHETAAFELAVTYLLRPWTKHNSQQALHFLQMAAKGHSGAATLYAEAVSLAAYENISLLSAIQMLHAEQRLALFDSQHQSIAQPAPPPPYTDSEQPAPVCLCAATNTQPTHRNQ